MATLTWAAKTFEAVLEKPRYIFPTREAKSTERKTLGCAGSVTQIQELGPPTLKLRIWYEGDSDPFNTFYTLLEAGTTSTITGMPTWGGTQTLTDYTLTNVEPISEGEGNHVGYLGATARAEMILTLKKMT